MSKDPSRHGLNVIPDDIRKGMSVTQPPFLALSNLFKDIFEFQQHFACRHHLPTYVSFLQGSKRAHFAQTRFTETQ